MLQSWYEWWNEEPTVVIEKCMYVHIRTKMIPTAVPDEIDVSKMQWYHFLVKNNTNYSVDVFLKIKLGTKESNLRKTADPRCATYIDLKPVYLQELDPKLGDIFEISLRCDKTVYSFNLIHK